MPSLDPKTVDRIASTLIEWGWRLIPVNNASHRWTVYPPSGMRPFVLAPMSGRDTANLYANLRRCGVEMDPKRRAMAKSAVPATTGRARAAVAPTSPASPSSPPAPAAPVPVPDELPGWALTYWISRHAFERMAERRITEWEVRAAIAWPQFTRTSRSDPRNTICTRGDIEVVINSETVVTILDRNSDERIEPRSPAAPPSTNGGGPITQGVNMSTSDRIREYVRTKVTGQFSPTDVVRALNDPLVNTGLVTVVLGGLVKAGEVRRPERGVYVPVGARRTPTFVEPMADEAATSVELDEAGPVRTAEPAAVPRPRKAATSRSPEMITAFTWAEPPAKRESLAARQRNALVELVTEHLDELKNRPGEWAMVATMPEGTNPSTVQDRATALRKAVTGLAVRTYGQSIYVRIEG